MIALVSNFLALVRLALVCKSSDNVILTFVAGIVLNDLEQRSVLSFQDIDLCVKLSELFLLLVP